MNGHVIDVALGKQPADVVIKNGKLVNVLTKEIYLADIAIADGVIAATGELAPGCIGEKTKVIDAKGKYLAPGFIDAHIHFESSMLSFTEFNRVVLTKGTTAVASDVMEVSIVSGYKAIKEVLKEAEGLPVKLLNPILGFTQEDETVQTVGATMDSDVLDELISMPSAIGFAETTPHTVLSKNPMFVRIKELADKYKKTLEGHAPELRGPELNAYASVGIRSDHECVAADEELDKLRHGIRVLIREGSAAKDLKACIKVITENQVDPRYCSIVSDDIDMHYILTNGHLDHKVRMVVQEGVDPVVALQMVTINPAESLKVDDRYGSIAPGKCADVVFLSDLENCTVVDVVANGELVVENGKVIYEFKPYDYPDFMRNTVHLPKKMTADDLVLRVDNAKSSAKVRVIGTHGHTLLSDALEAELSVEDGVIKPDVTNDILHVACIERYGKNGSIGRAFVKGFGFKRGAVATSVGHDHHNVTAIGADANDMAMAINRLGELGGGIVVVNEGKVLYELALPICGLLCTQDGIESAKVLAAMQNYLAEIGCQMESPMLSLSFVTLTIPSYAITDQGLIDVAALKPVDPIISSN
ncbi:Adenine deaminase [Paenibacillus tianmuensis]|uniref:Adenine deaminase n=1 Tax=Paenibacillus tianmuensis TaxID=624147 RepID=A0A1G4SUW1_9BACL|nr:adenine deaminase C-terminal domain-containing protein [Paenibacillus tianmuensis]SCW72811.1 Adenine deaminase [Paenibacillus tianmuensis]